jgi:hypothetical protein
MINKNNSLLYGRYVYDIRNLKIPVCMDFPPVKINLTIEEFKKEINNNYYEISIPQNSHIMRAFYNNNEKKWFLSTSNRLFASESIYQTNKNKEIKMHSLSFEQLFKRYDKDKIINDKLIKSKTYFFALRIPEIFIISEVKKGEIIKLCSIDNITNEFIAYPNDQYMKTIFSRIIYVDKQMKYSFEQYSDDYILRKSVIENYSNVRYIALINIKKSEQFKSLFPYWKNCLDENNSIINNYSKKLVYLYKLLYISGYNIKQKNKLVSYILTGFSNKFNKTLLGNFLEKPFIYNKMYDNYYKSSNKHLIMKIKKENPIIHLYLVKIYNLWLKNKNIEINNELIKKKFLVPDDEKIDFSLLSIALNINNI